MANSQNNSGVGMTRIINLKPGERNWTIIARVVYKAPIRPYSNKISSGNLFTVNLLDESGEIKAAAYDSNLDLYHLHESLILNEVYFISDASVKSIDSGSKYLQVHDYELIVTEDTRFVKIPNLKFKFTPIANIEFPVNEYVDVIGVCTKDGGLQPVVRKDTGMKTKLRKLELFDENSGRITLTLWSPEAEEYNELMNSVIVVRNALVRKFNDTTSLNVCPSSMLFVNPPMEEALKLRKWFDNQSTSQLGERLNKLSL